jgi:preprotein translocase subunit SecD
MNHYSLWKNLLIVAVIVFGALFALPNLFGDDPAVQVSAGRNGNVDLALMSQVETALKTQSVAYKRCSIKSKRCT